MRLAAPLLLSCALALSACGRPAAHTAAPADAVSETFDGEALTVAVRASSAKITTADRITLDVETTVAPGYTPPEGPTLNKLGGFTVAQRTVGPVRAGADGRASITTTYTLEPFLPGDYEIPPLELVAVPVPAAAPDPGENASPSQAETIVTAPIPIAVASVLEGPDEELDIAEIKPIAEAPTDWRHIALWGAAAGAAVVIAGALIGAAVWRRARPAPPPPPPPPHEVALAAIRALRERGLVEHGEVKLYYSELSDILRRYIEHRFTLHAPERTTEEFLREATTSGLISAEDVPHLRRFLRACDMVKFAEDRPTAADADDTAEIARGFVERSIPRPAEPGPVRP